MAKKSLAAKLGKVTADHVKGKVAPKTVKRKSVPKKTRTARVKASGSLPVDRMSDAQFQALRDRANGR